MIRSKSGTSSQGVPVLHKAIRLLRGIAEGAGQSVSLAQLASAHQVATTTCFRILNTLREEGFVAATPGGGWRLSAGLMPLVRGLAPYAELAERLAPVLQSLSGSTGLTAKLSVLEGHESVTLLRISPPQSVSITSPPGARFPVVVGATGSALLAGLLESGAGQAAVDAAVKAAPAEAWRRQTRAELARRVEACRRHGWCHDVGGYHEQVAAVAAVVPPAARPAGVVAAVSLIGWPADVEPAKRQRLAKALRTALAEAGKEARP
ncbi:MAG: IclR family transcriptional regulator [Phycisphaerae bacterium]